MSDSNKDRQAESRRIIGRVGLESEAAMARSDIPADKCADAADGRAAPADDRIEFWGTRIGRWLGLASLAYILWWLYDFMTMGG